MLATTLALALGVVLATTRVARLCAIATVDVAGTGTGGACVGGGKSLGESVGEADDEAAFAATWWCLGFEPNTASYPSKPSATSTSTRMMATVCTSGCAFAS